MRRLSALLLITTLAVAGCFASTQDPAEDAEQADATVQIDENRPEPSFNDIPEANLGELAMPDANATLLEPPQLVAGEWWRIELTDGFTGETSQFIRVVAKVEDDLYVIGMPHEGWWKEAVIFHSPGFGDVNKDLSHRAHDYPFVPLQFPLEDGATWETMWESPDPVTATVAVESPTTARITFTGTSCGIWGFLGQCPAPSTNQIIELVYDATMHEVVEASFPTHTWRVVEHGYGFEGWVTVPRAEHLVFFHGRLGLPVVDPFKEGGLSAGAPIETVEIAGGFNRVSFILGVGNAVGAAPGGAYRETATAPDGTAYSIESIPGEPFHFEFYEHANPDGAWTLEHIAAGPGLAFVEGIAYHQYDIHLPSGNIRSDHAHEVVR